MRKYGLRKLLKDRRECRAADRYLNANSINLMQPSFFRFQAGKKLITTTLFLLKIKFKNKTLCKLFLIDHFISYLYVYIYINIHTMKNNLYRYGVRAHLNS